MFCAPPTFMATTTRPRTAKYRLMWPGSTMLTATRGSRATLRAFVTVRVQYHRRRSAQRQPPPNVPAADIAKTLATSEPRVAFSPTPSSRTCRLT